MGRRHVAPGHARSSCTGTGVLSLESGEMTLLLMGEGNRGNSSLTRLQAPVEGEAGDSGRMVAYGGLGAPANSLPKLSVDPHQPRHGRRRTPSKRPSRDARGDPPRWYAATSSPCVDINDDKDRLAPYLTYENGKDRKVLEEVSEMGQPLVYLRPSQRRRAHRRCQSSPGRQARHVDRDRSQATSAQ